MAVVEFPSKTEQAKHLVLFLPGLGDSPENVERGGMIEEMKGAPQFDALIADAHFGYYRTGTMTTRLDEDVVHRVRSEYDEFWIVGTSMGGYGAIAYAEKFPESVTGLVLLAPYLGQGKVLADIERAGSVQNWNPEAFQTTSSRTAHGVRLWAWLKERPTRPSHPIVFLGSGDQDKLLRGFRLLSPALEANRVTIIPGGHDWTTWRKLFHRVVESTLSTR